jgi:hypothetical protein
MWAMASLRHLASGRISILEPEHLVGRSPHCALRLDEVYVSAQHASFRWTGASWEVRDLGSRNGTFVNGSQVRSGQPCSVHRGAHVAFGQLDQEWLLEGDGEPSPMVIPADGQAPWIVDSDILAIPSPDDPQVTLYRGSDGQWRLERSDGSIEPLQNRSEFELDNRSYRFSCAGFVARTATCEQSREVRRAKLLFAFSQDEEHVHLTVERGGTEFDLGSRSHHYLLLLLARRRAAEEKDDATGASSGWVYQDELVKWLATTPQQLNIDIFRIRRQFSGLDLLDAPDIIERRPRTRQLRIGASAFEFRRV